MANAFGKIAMILAAIIGAVVAGGGVWLVFAPLTATPWYITVFGAAAVAAGVGAVFAWRRRSADKTIASGAIGYAAVIFAVLGAAIGVGVEFASQFQLLIAIGAGALGALFAYASAKRIASERRLKRQSS